MGRSKSVWANASPVRLAVAMVTPWYARCRAMIFFFCGRPSALLMYHASLIAVSFASDPELANSALDIPGGAIPIRRSASSVLMAGTLPAKLLIERQLAHLPIRRIREPPLREAKGRAPEAGHAFEVAPALVVVDVNAFAARDHERTFGLHLPQVGGGMQMEREVAACGRSRE